MGVLYLDLSLNLILFLSITRSQVPQSRKRLILRGSCPCSRLGHTSDFHSYSRFRWSVVPTKQQASADIFLLGRFTPSVFTFSVNVFSDCCHPDPTQQRVAQLRHHLASVEGFLLGGCLLFDYYLLSLLINRVTIGYHMLNVSHLFHGVTDIIKYNVMPHH